ncbi:phosphopantetheine-binding protein [Streptomyces sp. CA-181903]|uniref:phosphopantetheine-binding protein n=1 Tax=Streptomyces sp. CA-181903 TaxID=3240055 RepID=UPI003D901A7D
MTPTELERLLTRVVHGEKAPPDKTIGLSGEALDRSFEDLDVDSLARAELITIVSDDYGIEISDAQASALTTARSVLDFVNTRLDARAARGDR